MIGSVIFGRMREQLYPCARVRNNLFLTIIHLIRNQEEFISVDEFIAVYVYIRLKLFSLVFVKVL